MQGLAEVGEEQLRGWRNNEIGEGRSLSYGGMVNGLHLYSAFLPKQDKVLHVLLWRQSGPHYHEVQCLATNPTNKGQHVLPPEPQSRNRRKEYGRNITEEIGYRGTEE